MRPRALGLVARMALGAALGAALLTALLGGLTYAALAQQWVRSDERALLGKLRQVSTLLAQSASPGLLIEQPRYLRDSMSGEGNAIVRLLGADGRLLLEINAAGWPCQPRRRWPMRNARRSIPSCTGRPPRVRRLQSCRPRAGWGPRRRARRC